MTEQEYILATNRRALDCAIAALSTIHGRRQTVEKMIQKLSVYRDELDRQISEKME